MLDLTKLLPQFDGITAGILHETGDESLEKAAAALLAAATDPEAFQSRVALARGLTFWPLAIPLEPVDSVHHIEPMKATCCVLAVDGSQIMPSHHEVYNCYLINIGKVAITYGVEESVVMDSTPHLFHSVEDLYPVIDKRRVYVDEPFVALERNLLELSTLRDLALEKQAVASHTVAFVDGSLIQWSLDQMPESYQRTFTQRLMSIYDSFATNKIPLIGYVSNSRSSDVVNALRVWQCPYENAECSRYCSELCEDDYPCSTIWPTVDRQLFGRELQRGFRAPLFVSGVPRANLLSRNHQVAFTYVSSGSEVARIEMPRWLAEDKQLLEVALSAVVSQCQKGGGYPIGLAEAHNLAVIHTSDRNKFFELVERHLVKLGTPGVRVSPKESGKRRGIV